MFIYKLCRFGLHLLRHLLSAYNVPSTAGGAVDERSKNMPVSLQGFSV